MEVAADTELDGEKRSSVADVVDFYSANHRPLKLRTDGGYFQRSYNKKTDGPKFEKPRLTAVSP